MLWYSLEAPHWGTSNEYPQHMFSWKNKKNIMWKPSLTGALKLTVIFGIFVSHLYILQNTAALWSKQSGCHGHIFLWICLEPHWSNETCTYWCPWSQPQIHIEPPNIWGWEKCTAILGLVPRTLALLSQCSANWAICPGTRPIYKYVCHFLCTYLLFFFFSFIFYFVIQCLASLLDHISID